MTDKEYRRTPLRLLVGRRARVTRELASGAGYLTAGAVVTIKDKFRGFSVKADKCSHCGVGLFMTRVPPEDLELLEEGDSR